MSKVDNVSPSAGTAAKSIPRRKSAHGRLQSSTTSVGDGRREEGTEEGRERPRRVKSARETLKERASSVVFPTVTGVRVNAVKWGTQYADDFGYKQPTAPVPVRPASPTRRNNPHPAKPFLQWKHPVRIHTHKKSVQPPEEAWKYISEGFYDDYTDTRNTGDAKNEVPVTNVAKIDFPGNTKNGCSPLGSKHLISGTKAQLNPRSQLHRAGDTTPVIRPPSPKSKMMLNTVRGNTLPLLREWLKTASNKEREIVLKMLTAANTDSEDTRLEKAVDNVLHADSASRVQQWLQSATSSEKKTLLSVLEMLAVASADLPQPPHVVFPVTTCNHPAPTEHYRAYSHPITLRPRVSHNHKKHNHTMSQREHYSRHSHHCHHCHHCHHHTAKHHKPHCHKAHKSSGHVQGIGKETEGDMTLVGRRLDTKRAQTPELWHHKIPPSTQELRVLHPGSVFQQPHKDRGRHYAIHPEWPTA